MDNKYHNAKIYKIVDVGYNKCYIGSTCEELSQRMARHRINFKRFLNGKVRHTRSFDLFNEYGIENCKIELIENYSCISKAELLRKEGEHIKNNDCVNKTIPGRTQKEYREDNIDRIKERDKAWWKIYYQEHKEEIKEQKQIYRDTHKEERCAAAKLYYENNKEKLKQKQAEVYALKKDEINAKKREKRRQQRADTTV